MQNLNMHSPHCSADHGQSHWQAGPGRGSDGRPAALRLHHAEECVSAAAATAAAAGAPPRQHMPEALYYDGRRAAPVMVTSVTVT
jgi:hypothetical protein